MGVFEVRCQRKEFQVWKKYCLNDRADCIGIYPTFFGAKSALRSFGGVEEQEDYHGPYRLFLKESWVTCEETN